MNKDIFEGKTKELHGQIKVWWGKITDDDLEQAGGNVEQIVGLIQQKYGYTRQQAEAQFNLLVKSLKTNQHQAENKIRHAAGKAQKDLVTWVEDGASQWNEGFEKLTDDAKEGVADAVTAVKKDVGSGLKRYNTKAQEVANKFPGSFGKKATKYPWVTISIALVAGFLLGNLLKPGRQFAG